MTSCVWNIKEPDSQRQSRMKLGDSGGEDQGTQDMRLPVTQSKFKGSEKITVATASYNTLDT